MTDVRFGPKADIEPSVDQLVGTGKQGRRDLKAERLGCFEIDDQSSLSWSALVPEDSLDLPLYSSRPISPQKRRFS